MALALFATTSCRSAAQREVTRELSAIGHTIDQLRNAPHDAKTVPLSALEQLRCQSPPACELQQVCAQAYRLHVNALGLVKQTAAMAAHDTARVGDILLQAERDLKHATQGAHRCVQLQGELAREYRL